MSDNRQLRYADSPNTTFPSKLTYLLFFPNVPFFFNFVIVNAVSIYSFWSLTTKSPLLQTSMPHIKINISECWLYEMLRMLGTENRLPVCGCVSVFILHLFFSFLLSRCSLMDQLIFLIMTPFIRLPSVRHGFMQLRFIHLPLHLSTLIILIVSALVFVSCVNTKSSTWIFLVCWMNSCCSRNLFFCLIESQIKF